MKKIRRIIVAALSICMISALSAVPGLADVNVNLDPDDPDRITYIAVTATGDSENNENMEYPTGDDPVGDVTGFNESEGFGTSVTAEAVANSGGTATAAAAISGSVDTNINDESGAAFYLSGVNANSVVKKEGSASAEVNVDGSVTVGSEDYSGIAVGINVSAKEEEPAAFFLSHDGEKQSSEPMASSTVSVGDSVNASSTELAVGIHVQMQAGNADKTVETDVNVKGNVEAKAGIEAVGIGIEPFGDHVGEAYTSINVGGNVKATYTGVNDDGMASGIRIEHFGSPTSDGLKDTDIEAEIGGDIIADGGKSAAYGMNLSVGRNSKVNISADGNILATGTDSCGVYIKAFNESEVNINAGGNVSGAYDGANIYTQKGGQVNLHVKGDLDGKYAGLDLLSEGEGNIIDVVVEETLSGGDHVVAVCNQNSLNALQLTVWKAELNEDGHIISLTEEAEANLDEDAAEALNAAIEAKEQEFLYIIKFDQPTAGGTLSLSKEDGNPLDKSHDYFNVARQYEKVLLKINVEDGYQLTGAFNNDSEKLSLYQDVDNVYYVIVPKGGGVYLTATFMKLPELRVGKEENRPAEKEEEQKPEQQQTVILESQPVPVMEPLVRRVSRQVKIILEKDDLKPGAKITFFDDRTFLVRRYDETALKQRLNGTFSVKNGEIELTLSDGTVSQIDKNGTLILQTGEAWKDYRSLADDDPGTCHFEFSSDDLTILLSSLTDVR